MGYREVRDVDIGEVLRRWQGGESQRKIAAGTGLSRNTVAKYIELAGEAGVDRDRPASDSELAGLQGHSQLPGRQRGPNEQLLSQHEAQLQEWVCRERLQLTRVHELLLEQLGVKISYKGLYRFVLAREWLPAHRGTVRMAATKPGEVVEVDFGYLGRIADETGRLRKAWAFSVVLPFSRHMHVTITFKQDIPAAIAAFEAAWAFFQGVPRRVVLDNFPAAVEKANNYDPLLTRTLAEYSQHRGFILDTARIRHPKDKPHTERSVPYVRERLYKGGVFRDINDANRQAVDWCRRVAGQRIHGTTRLQPLAVFDQVEQATLLPWDSVPYDVPKWATPKVAPDYHLQFDKALYSVPERYRGRRVEVRGDRQLVRVYLHGALIKTHPRKLPGERSTDYNDYPAHRRPYAIRAPEHCIEQGREQGEHIGRFLTELLAGDFPWAKLRQAYKCLRLAERYGAERVNQACQRAVDHGLLNIFRVEKMLQLNIEQRALELPVAEGEPPPGRFARPGSAFTNARLS
jgi:transposase